MVQEVHFVNPIQSLVLAKDGSITSVNPVQLYFASKNPGPY